MPIFQNISTQLEWMADNSEYLNKQLMTLMIPQIEHLPHLLTDKMTPSGETTIQYNLRGETRETEWNLLIGVTPILSSLRLTCIFIIFFAIL